MKNLADGENLCLLQYLKVLSLNIIKTTLILPEGFCLTNTVTDRDYLQW